MDLDPQTNSTLAMGAKTNGVTILDVLNGTATAKDAIQETPAGSVIASHRALAGADGDFTGKGAGKLLRKALKPIRGQYDDIVIDCPPALGILTVNALVAADRLIIPAMADIFSLQGVDELARTVEAVKEEANPDLEVTGILLTRHNNRTNLAQQVTALAEQLAQKLGTRVFETKIRESVTVRESQILQQSLFDYAPKSNPAQDYGQFIEELLGG